MLLKLFSVRSPNVRTAPSFAPNRKGVPSVPSRAYTTSERSGSCRVTPEPVTAHCTRFLGVSSCSPASCDDQIERSTKRSRWISNGRPVFSSRPDSKRPSLSALRVYVLFRLIRFALPSIVLRLSSPPQSTVSRPVLPSNRSTSSVPPSGVGIGNARTSSERTSVPYEYVSEPV